MKEVVEYISASETTFYSSNFIDSAIKNGDIQVCVLKAGDTLKERHPFGASFYLIDCHTKAGSGACLILPNNFKNIANISSEKDIFYSGQEIKKLIADGIIEIRILSKEDSEAKYPLGTPYHLLNYELEVGSSGKHYIYPKQVK